MESCLYRNFALYWFHGQVITYLFFHYWVFLVTPTKYRLLYHYMWRTISGTLTNLPLRLLLVITRWILTGLAFCGEDFSFCLICGPVRSRWNTRSFPATFSNKLSESLADCTGRWLATRGAEKYKCDV